MQTFRFDKNRFKILFIYSTVADGQTELKSEMTNG